MIKSYQEYLHYLVQEGLNSEELNEKRIISRHELFNMVQELGIMGRDKALNDELISAILQAIEPILTRMGYIIDMGKPIGVWK
jgi:hypothetical protein